MKSKVSLLLFAIFMSFSLLAGLVPTVDAKETKSENAQSTRKKTNSDKARKEKADKIISDMTDKGASSNEIQHQKSANKKYYGHEGEYR